MRTQSLLLVTDGYAPYPDRMILRGPATDHRCRRPVAADVLCLIEGAGSRDERDSVVKLAAYARVGVPQYVIVDLRRRVAEVNAGPDAVAGTYPPPGVVGADGAVVLRVGEAETVAVPLAELLP